MNTDVSQFKTFCGKKYEQFLDSIYVGANDKVELKFWQEKLITDFYAKYPDTKTEKSKLVEMIRDGRELTYGCPIEDCGGTVCCVDRKDDLWGCGECGNVWESKRVLDNAINKK